MGFSGVLALAGWGGKRTEGHALLEDQREVCLATFLEDEEVAQQKRKDVAGETVGEEVRRWWEHDEQGRNSRDQAKDCTPSESEPTQTKALIEVVCTSSHGTLGAGEAAPHQLQDPLLTQLVQRTRIRSSRLLSPAGIARFLDLVSPRASVKVCVAGERVSTAF